MYAVEVIDNSVARVIVGDSQWAASELGGNWIQSDVLFGVGWVWNGETYAPVDPPGVTV